MVLGADKQITWGKVYYIVASNNYIISKYKYTIINIKLGIILYYVRKSF